MLRGLVAIGFVAHVTGLPIALGGVALLLAIVSALASTVRPAAPRRCGFDEPL